MKRNKLLKSIPFLLTLIILIILSISNQKQYAKLKILIWNTPTLSLGTYLAISGGTGFLISYIFTSNLAGVYKLNHEKKIKYKYEQTKIPKDSYNESNHETIYENTLIERDIKEPLPTINASFRVIGKTNKIDQTIQNNDNNEYSNEDITDEYDYQYYENEVNYKNKEAINSILNDWDDDIYTNW